MTDPLSAPTSSRYEISILIGPCSQEDAERATIAAHEAADAAVPGAGTGLNFWDEEKEAPGWPVDGTEVIG